ncbi:hypothetical protein LINPERPRIM_LOCUS24946 [Linum perenne]
MMPRSSNVKNPQPQSMKDKVEGAGKGKVRVDVTKMATKDKDKEAGKGKMRVDEAEKRWKAIPHKSVKPIRFMMHRSSNVKNPQPQAMKDNVEGAGKGKVRVDVTKMAMRDKDKEAGKGKMRVNEAEKIMDLTFRTTRGYGTTKNDIQRRLENEQDEDKWKKLMILYIIVVLLCSKERLQASLKFLPLLEEGCIGEFTNYNWCKYVVEHFHNGFRAAKQNKKT